MPEPTEAVIRSNSVGQAWYNGMPLPLINAFQLLTSDSALASTLATRTGSEQRTCEPVRSSSSRSICELPETVPALHSTIVA